MKNLFYKLLLMIVIFSTLLTSCLKDETEEQRAEEKRILENYIATNNITVTPSESGLYYIETLTGTGPAPEDSMWLEINYTTRLVSTEKVVMTSDLEVAKDNNIYSGGVYYGPVRLVLGMISYQGLNEGIAKMKEGGKSRLIFPSDLGLGGQNTANIPAYSSLIFDVELLKVIPDIRAYEAQKLLDYLNANEFSTDSTGSGIYYKETKAGDGAQPIAGDLVMVTYKGKFLNGTVFDSSAKSFNFNIGYGDVIKGFEEAVKLMKKGGSATVVIPYYYAYGEFGRLDSYYRTVIPPYTTLVFEINLTDIN